MSDGLSTTNADAALGTITGTYAAYIKLHTGDPGSAGTANPSSVTTREAVTWAAASGGSIATSDAPEWSSWGGTSPETITDISFWDMATGGTFGLSMQLTASVTMMTGDSLTLTTGGITITIPTAS